MDEDIYLRYVRTCIGAQLKEYRRKKNYSLREMAERCNVPYPNICNIEKGKATMTLNTLVRMCDVLGLEITLKEKDGESICIDD